MKKVGIYGGTFDPIHNGHLVTAKKLCEERKYYKIIFIPCFISPHKVDRVPVSSEHRLEMVKLAVKDNAKFSFSGYEMDKGGVSFTYNTILHCKKYFEHIELIIGMDNLLVFDKWYKPDEIEKMVTLVVMKRKSTDNKIIKNKYFDHAVFADTPLVNISSSDIRKRIKKNLPIDNLVPAAVKDYLAKNNLYK